MTDTRNVIHYYETTEERTARLCGKRSGQAICSSGDGHQVTTRDKNRVTCSYCLDILKSMK